MNSSLRSSTALTQAEAVKIMDCLADIPYRCPRCGDKKRFLTVTELKDHLESRHSYKALKERSLARRQRLESSSRHRAGMQKQNQKCPPTSEDFNSGRYSPILQSFNEDAINLEQKVREAKQAECLNKMLKSLNSSRSPSGNSSYMSNSSHLRNGLMPNVEKKNNQNTTFEYSLQEDNPQFNSSSVRNEKFQQSPRENNSAPRIHILDDLPQTQSSEILEARKFEPISPINKNNKQYSDSNKINSVLNTDSNDLPVTSSPVDVTTTLNTSLEEELQQSVQDVFKEQSKTIQKLQNDLKIKELMLVQVNCEVDHLKLEKNRLEKVGLETSQHTNVHSGKIEDLEGLVQKTEEELQHKNKELRKMTTFLREVAEKEAVARNDLEDFINDLIDRASDAEMELKSIKQTQQLGLNVSAPAKPPRSIQLSDASSIAQDDDDEDLESPEPSDNEQYLRQERNKWYLSHQTGVPASKTIPKWRQQLSPDDSMNIAYNEVYTTQVDNTQIAQSHPNSDIALSQGHSKSIISSQTNSNRLPHDSFSQNTVSPPHSSNLAANRDPHKITHGYNNPGGLLYEQLEYEITDSNVQSVGRTGVIDHGPQTPHRRNYLVDNRPDIYMDSADDDLPVKLKMSAQLDRQGISPVGGAHIYADNMVPVKLPAPQKPERKVQIPGEASRVIADQAFIHPYDITDSSYLVSTSVIPEKPRHMFIPGNLRVRNRLPNGQHVYWQNRPANTYVSNEPTAEISASLDVSLRDGDQANAYDFNDEEYIHDNDATSSSDVSTTDFFYDINDGIPSCYLDDDGILWDDSVLGSNNVLPSQVTNFPVSNVEPVSSVSWSEVGVYPIKQDINLSDMKPTTMTGNLVLSSGTNISDSNRANMQINSQRKSRPVGAMKVVSAGDVVSSKVDHNMKPSMVKNSPLAYRRSADPIIFTEIRSQKKGADNSVPEVYQLSKSHSADSDYPVESRRLNPSESSPEKHLGIHDADVVDPTPDLPHKQAYKMNNKTTLKLQITPPWKKNTSNKSKCDQIIDKKPQTSQPKNCEDIKKTSPDRYYEETEYVTMGEISSLSVEDMNRKSVSACDTCGDIKEKMKLIQPGKCSNKDYRQENRSIPWHESDDDVDLSIVDCKDEVYDVQGNDIMHESHNCYHSGEECEYVEFVPSQSSHPSDSHHHPSDSHQDSSASLADHISSVDLITKVDKQTRKSADFVQGRSVPKFTENNCSALNSVYGEKENVINHRFSADNTPMPSTRSLNTKSVATSEGSRRLPNKPETVDPAVVNTDTSHPVPPPRRRHKGVATKTDLLVKDCASTDELAYISARDMGADYHKLPSEIPIPVIDKQTLNYPSKNMAAVEQRTRRSTWQKQPMRKASILCSESNEDEDADNISHDMSRTERPVLIGASVDKEDTVHEQANSKVDIRQENDPESLHHADGQVNESPTTAQTIKQLHSHQHYNVKNKLINNHPQKQHVNKAQDLTSVMSRKNVDAPKRPILSNAVQSNLDSASQGDKQNVVSDGLRRIRMPDVDAEFLISNEDIADNDGFDDLLESAVQLKSSSTVPTAPSTPLAGKQAQLSSKHALATSRRCALLRIFKHLSIKDLCTVGLVCKEWKLVSRHPRLWMRIHLQDARVSAKFLQTMTQWCTQIISLTFQGLTPRPRHHDETSEEFQSSTRGCLEFGFEHLLKVSHSSLLSLRISDCGNLFTERCLWQVSCYSRLLQRLCFVTDHDTVGPEVLWALGAGCPDIKTLILPPGSKGQGVCKFINKCAQLIAKCYPDLTVLCIGGKDVSAHGFLAIVEHCQRLQVLEFDHMCHIDLDLAIAMCGVGLKSVRNLEFTYTSVAPEAVLKFINSCKHLQKLTIRLNMDVCVRNKMDPDSIFAYHAMVNSLQARLDSLSLSPRNSPYRNLKDLKMAGNMARILDIYTDIAS